MSCAQSNPGSRKSNTRAEVESGIGTLHAEASAWMLGAAVGPCADIQRSMNRIEMSFVDRVIRQASERSRFVYDFGFAIPCAEAIAAVVKRSRSLVEVGAGTGLWSALIAREGVDVIATDAMIGRWAESFIGFGAHFKTSKMLAQRAVQRLPKRDVLMVWPHFSSAYPATVARLMQPGRRLYYVGEPRGGCCANEAFFDVMAPCDEWEIEARIEIPQWSGLHDDMVVYRKVS